MKRSTIWILTIVMVVTILGLLAVQIVYMEKMIQMRNEQFSENVTRSIHAVSTMLEQNETKYYLEQDLQEAASAYGATRRYADAEVSMPVDSSSASESIDGIKIQRPANFNTLKNLNDSYQLKQEILVEQYMYQRSMLNEVILTILTQSSDRPIGERADSATVREYLVIELENNGLSLPFEFAVTRRGGATDYSTAGYAPLVASGVTPYVHVLFPGDPVGKQHYLNVVFPTKSKYIFSSVKYMIPALAFTLVLLAVFIYTVFIAFKQKRLSEIKTDFINNMTHEFKTPISSLSIAAQMLSDNSVTKSPQMLSHVTRVITEETKRLRFQVEKLLHMSMFDRDEATMRLEEEDANALVESVVSTFKLRAEKYGGSIETSLDAEDPIVNVDRMHMTNVVFNLLDNAIKYRREEVPLELRVSTRNPDDKTLEIVVEDNGIGIKREDLKRIFDKFYRVNTGNRHDVKGFGLGLAYVQKMVSLFKGTIRAESEPGNGTRFVILLPLYS